MCVISIMSQSVYNMQIKIMGHYLSVELITPQSLYACYNKPDSQNWRSLADESWNAFKNFVLFTATEHHL